MPQAQAVTAKVLSLPRYQAAERIGIFLSMPTAEIRTRAIVLDAIARGKQVFVPYIYGERHDGPSRSRKLMDMVSLHSKEDFEDVECNRDNWRIPQVPGTSIAERYSVVSNEKSIAKRDLDVILMPGVAFDYRGGRLGHGKGFYDSFLERYQDGRSKDADGRKIDSPNGMPFLVGLALKEQMMAPHQDVPTGPGDWFLDAVITGDGSIIEVPATDDGHGGNHAVVKDLNHVS